MDKWFMDVFPLYWFCSIANHGGKLCANRSYASIYLISMKCLTYLFTIFFKNSWRLYYHSKFCIHVINKCYLHLAGCEWIQTSQNWCQMSTFLQFLLHLSIWCHFNGMWIMENCDYWIIGILKKLKWIKKNSISKFGLNKGCLITSFNNINFIKGPLVLII